MYGTPRLRAGAFPSTPQTGFTSARRTTSTRPANTTPSSPRIRDISSLKPSISQDSQPLIPFTTLDAPSQRFYVVAAYLVLFFWKLYDFYKLTEDETESLWLFMKWVAIDGVSLYGLPNMRIPWLEWSVMTTTILFCVHALIDGILMFRIPIPLGSGLVALTRVLYDREISISERRVKPADILNNPSLILGRQIIHILPEGSAVLNPDKIPICIDTTKSSSAAILPLQINQTTPTSIEFIRFDLESQLNETVTIGAKAIKGLKKEAERHTPHHKPSDPLLLTYAVKKPGLYRLGRIIDETKLEVQHKRSEVFVVPCPRASIKSSGSDKCRGDLSNVAIEVQGTPPLKIKYTRSVNGDSGDVSYQSIQPDDYLSPLTQHNPVILHGSEDHTWARSRTVVVPLNETLVPDGKWTYGLTEVVDAFGNSMHYTMQDEELSIRSKGPHLEDTFVVHNRPQASIQSSGGQLVVRAAKGKSTTLPIRVRVPGKNAGPEDTFAVTYEFTPEADETLDNSSERRQVARTVSIQKGGPLPQISEPGIYTLKTVVSSFCEGDVLEPKSFRLFNPPEPTIKFEDSRISDKANRTVGTRVALDFTGSPPFKISYNVRRERGQVHTYTKSFDGPRGVLELKPETDGRYTYTFNHVSDDVYTVPIDKVLEQTVKPSVSAAFVNKEYAPRICIDQTASYDVRLQGERPWSLVWETVQGGRRKTHRVENITSTPYRITTEPLTAGGEWSVALVSVTDGEACTETLSHSAKVFVRHQKPTAGFGSVEGKQQVRTLESKRIPLPVRLSGDGPWNVKYSYTQDGQTVRTRSEHLKKANDVIEVQEAGTYELLEISDHLCPGNVDKANKKFKVDWIGRPSMSIAESNIQERRGDKIQRKSVCEGAEDAFEVNLFGTPPFDIKYEEHIKPDSGARSVRPAKALQLGLHTAPIKLDTSVAGVYDYIFSELGDYNYDHDGRRYTPLIVNQHVHPRPTAVFTHSGNVYSFCNREDELGRGNDDTTTIPVTLTGQPPFQIDLEIKPFGKAARAIPLNIPNIPDHSHKLNIPHRLLQTGTSTITIKRIRDSRGCERTIDQIQPSHRVQISVHENPTIAPSEPDRIHYCPGEHVVFSLGGVAPFEVSYTFNNKRQKARVDGHSFRRLAQDPGNFTVTGISDAAGMCKSTVSFSKMIHKLPSVKVSKGKETYVDIHAGGHAPIEFAFTGQAPFEFTYTRSENEDSKRRKGSNGGKPGQVLETKTLRSEDDKMVIQASEEGTYEVIAIADAFCSYARPGAEGYISGRKMILN